MQYNTYLEYTIAPIPLILNKKQDIIIIATLKTKAENEGSLTSVTVDNILVDFGAAGSSGPTYLTSSKNAITQAQLQHDSNWKITQGGGRANSLTVTPQPNTTGQVTSNAIFINVKDVIVNDTKGNVNVTITESLSKTVGSTDTGPTVNQTTLTVPKIAGDDGAQTTFKASHYSINTQNQPNVVLSWNGPAEPVYSLHYLYLDQLINVPAESPGGSEGNLGNKSSYTLYPSSTPSITPSNTQNYMPEETTTFILKIKDGTATPTYQTLTVVVENANLVSNSLTTNALVVGNPATFPGTTNIRLNGQIQVGDGTNSGIFIVPEETANGFIFKKGLPTSPTSLLQIQPSGDLVLAGGSINTSGGLSAGTTNTGSLTVGGTLSAQTGVRIMSVGTWRNCSGFAGTNATWLAGQEASSNGETIDGLDGFSTTNGAGNYGVYAVNLGTYLKGYVKVDLYMANYTGTGSGTFDVYSSKQELGANGYDSKTSYQVWTSTQSPNAARTNGNLVRKIVCGYFEGQYIYIGCKDDNNGQMGLRINKVEAFQAVGLQ